MASGAYSRKKGHDFERFVAYCLQQVDPSAVRNVEECQTASVDIKWKLPYGIQCKRLGKWSTSPERILEQADGGCTTEQLPVAIVQTNGNAAVVIMYFGDWVAMVAKIYRLEQELSRQAPCKLDQKAPVRDNGTRILLNATELMKTDPDVET